MIRRLVTAGLLAASLSLATAVPALAVTTVSRSGNTITITGGDEVNYVEQPSGSDSGPLRYSDPNGINFGPGCSDAGTGNTVECGVVGPGLVANVNLGGGDDTFRPEYVITTSPRLTVDLGAGNDTTWGSAGADTLNGGLGDDTITAMGGNDSIDGGDGKDRLIGSGGDDTVTGGPGVDSLFGDGDFSGYSYGNDTLNARDGEIDALSCSFGADTAVADANDTFDVLGDCESRDVAGARPGPAPGTGSTGGNASPLTVGLGTPKPLRLGAFLSGKPLKFTVTFSAACTVTVGLVVRRAVAKRLKIGQKDTAIARDVDQAPQGGTFSASLKIKSAFLSKLKRARSVKAVLVLVCSDASGAQPSTQRNVVLKR